jgi:glycosyltransferase involved in cell wall biosynthesis
MADSAATSNDLVYFYNIPAEKIRVVYAGVDEGLHPVRDAEQLAQVGQKYNLPEKYLLFLGTLQPRKNIARLVQAFAAWQAASGRNDIALVLAGKPGWLYDPAWVANVENVYQTGYVDDADVAALYSAALGFVMPSLYEGFGFPVLEAMRCEIPVLCSNTSSLPELAGDAAILVDPTDVNNIAAGINQLVTDEALRQTLIERSKQQAQKFTWQQAAQSALRVLEEAAQR